MAEVKRGMLKYYHRGLLSKKWKEYKFVLYDSSLLTWYSDSKHKKPDGMVLLKDVERYICVGPYTKCLPDFPRLDNLCDQVTLIAFPTSEKEHERDIVWLLCEDLDDLNSWMKAIIQTLPSKKLQMEKLNKVPSSSNDETIQTISEPETADNDNVQPAVLKVDSIDLPITAGLIGARLQGHAISSKKDPLENVGYDYAEPAWGAGEGWGCTLPLSVPGFPGIGGRIISSNRNALIPTDDDEAEIEHIIDPIGQILAEEDDDDVVKEATYELSKSGINDGGEEEEEAILTYFNDDDAFKMIDSDDK